MKLWIFVLQEAYSSNILGVYRLRPHGKLFVILFKLEVCSTLQNEIDQKINDLRVICCSREYLFPSAVLHLIKLVTHTRASFFPFKFLTGLLSSVQKNENWKSKLYSIISSASLHMLSLHELLRWSHQTDDCSYDARHEWMFETVVYIVIIKTMKIWAHILYKHWFETGQTTVYCNRVMTNSESGCLRLPSMYILAKP